jgi:DNA-directed RNA polymerase subunit RPC12/RpoP
MNFNNSGAGGQQPPRINITQDDLVEIKCSECGGTHFIQTAKIMAIPKMIIGTKENKIQPVPVGFACAECGAELDIESIATKNLMEGKIIDFNKNKGEA